MPIHSPLRVFVLGTIGAILLSGPAWGRTLKIGGTGAVTTLLVELAPAFKADSDITLDVIVGLGTSGANNALADGKLGIAVSGRHLRDKERARGLTEVATLRTPFGFVTSRRGPDNLKRSEVAQVLGQSRPLWSDGMPILITLRPVDESDNALLGDSFDGMTEVLQGLRKRPDLSVAATDQDNADIAERVKGSLAGASLVQMLAEKRNLRFVSIDGVAASLENYQNGTYPIGKVMHLVVPSTVSAEAAAFIAFLAKPATAVLLRDAGVIVGK